MFKELVIGDSEGGTVESQLQGRELESHLGSLRAVCMFALWHAAPLQPAEAMQFW